MKINILWTESAKKDLKSIFNFIYQSSQSKLIAKKIIAQIRNRMKAITSISLESGQIQEGLNSKHEYRYLIVGNYKIIYRIDNQAVIVITIFDTRQDPSKLVIKE